RDRRARGGGARRDRAVAVAAIALEDAVRRLDPSPALERHRVERERDVAAANRHGDAVAAPPARRVEGHERLAVDSLDLVPPADAGARSDGGRIELSDDARTGGEAPRGAPLERRARRGRDALAAEGRGRSARRDEREGDRGTHQWPEQLAFRWARSTQKRGAAR